MNKKCTILQKFEESAVDALINSKTKMKVTNSF
jgi:hypothetical protein